MVGDLLAGVQAWGFAAADITVALDSPGRRQRSARLAEVVLVDAAYGAAHVLSGLYRLLAARAGLPAGVQLIAFEIGAGAL